MSPRQPDRKITMHAWLSILFALVGVPLGSAGIAAPVGETVAAQAVPRAWETLPPTPMLPVPMRQRMVAVDGGRVWVGEYGIRNRGVPVLLLHGGLANSDYFGRLIPALTRAGYRVIAIDSRGHGRSSVSTRPYSYALMARDVVTVLDRVGVRQVDLVGWSDGGVIGLQLGLDAPARVRRLFAFGTNARLDGLRPGFDSTPLFTRYIARSTSDARRFGKSPADHAAFLDQISKMWAREPNFSAADLKSIAMPVTMALGQYDEAIARAHVEAVDSELADSTVVILPRTSHLAMIQLPDQFNAAVLSFLKWR